MPESKLRILFVQVSPAPVVVLPRNSSAPLLNATVVPAAGLSASMVRICKVPSLIFVLPVKVEVVPVPWALDKVSVPLESFVNSWRAPVPRMLPVTTVSPPPWIVRVRAVAWDDSPISPVRVNNPLELLVKVVPWTAFTVPGLVKLALNPLRPWMINVAAPLVPAPLNTLPKVTV